MADKVLNSNQPEHVLNTKPDFFSEEIHMKESTFLLSFLMNGKKDMF